MMPRDRRAARVVVAAVAFAAAAAILALRGRGGSGAAFREGFEDRGLSPRWTVTEDGDLASRRVDVVEGRPGDRALRVGGGSIGSRDDTVKFLGVRTAEPVVAGAGSRVAVDLDWNGQRNGSYLSGDVVLSPHATSGNPLAERDWIRVGYVGVPPGRNARLLVAVRADGRERTLFTDGWPVQNRAGRVIGRQRLEIRTAGTALEVLENGRRVLRDESRGLSFDRAFVYLQVSTHSNYPLRDILFDDVAITR